MQELSVPGPVEGRAGNPSAARSHIPPATSQHSTADQCPPAAAEWPLDPTTGVVRCVAAFGMPVLAFVLLWKAWLTVAVSAEGLGAIEILETVGFAKVFTELLGMPYWVQNR